MLKAILKMQSYQATQGVGCSSKLLFLLKPSDLWEDLKVPWSGDGRMEGNGGSSVLLLECPPAKDGLPDFIPWFRSISGFYPV